MMIAPGESVLARGRLRHLVRPNPQTVDTGKTEGNEQNAGTKLLLVHPLTN